MSNSAEVRYGIEKLYVFPYYQTREDYEKATGVKPPLFDGRKPPKYWFDPSAKDATRRNVVYEQIIAYAPNGAALADENGKPFLDVLLLTKEEAAGVNIPPKGVGQANIPGSDVPEVPPPLRPLRADEELFFPFPGVVAVRVKGTQEADRGFTEEDRATLLAIARKLGV